MSGRTVTEPDPTCLAAKLTGVARLHIFIPKHLSGYIFESFGVEYVGILNGIGKILRPFGIFYGHLVILWSFGPFLTN
jgi:hypothetical protein